MMFNWKKLLDLLTPCMAVALLAVSNSQPSYADEWYEDSPYYEEEAWYDITEWFDGNDYARTDEYYDEYDDDYDYDYDYNYYDEGYDYGYHYDADGDWDYGYHEDYGPSDYQSWYGYDDRYGDDDWFYDYWDDGYSYYSDWDRDGIYDYSYSYYDYDGDGFYDAYYTYHDWDDDGIFEDVEYHTFGDSTAGDDTSASKDKKSQQQRNSEKTASRREMVRGEITKTKKTSVRDSQHLVVELEKDNGNKCIVDLGPARKLQQMDLAEGDEISVRGPVTKVGNKRVLIAQELKSDGQSQNAKQIRRDRQQFQGEIADTRTSRIQDSKHRFAILATGEDKKFLVDLGRADAANFELSQGDRVTVTAAPAKIKDQKLLIAHDLRLNGEQYEIDRSRNSKSRKNRSQDSSTDRQQRQRSISGEVVSTREISVRDSNRKIAKIETDRGQRLLVDMGPAGELDVDIREGDEITVRGPLAKSKDQTVVLARNLEIDGQQIDLSRRAGRHSDATQRTIRGEITSTRKASVRGEQRQLAKVETEQGKSILIDLGDPQKLDGRIEEGSKIEARGALVRAGDLVVLIAYEFEDENGGTVSINRRRTPQSQTTR